MLLCIMKVYCSLPPQDFSKNSDKMKGVNQFLTEFYMSMRPQWKDFQRVYLELQYSTPFHSY